MLEATSNLLSLADYPSSAGKVPGGAIQQGRYRARFATGANDLDAVLRLRFQVFNLELGEGLASSYRQRRDEDAFDLYCHHLLVEELESRRVVGTYRMQTHAMAGAGRGFYSAGEFELEDLPQAVLREAVEVGRACIAQEHRHRHVLFLLWKGLARYLQQNEKRYYFGCCSLASQECKEGWQLYRQLAEEGHIDPTRSVRTTAAARCGSSGEVTVERVHPPMLFRTYLRYGAQVISPPALDRDFKTIDFLVLFDLNTLDARRRAIFLEE